jgi:hypothetical protein
MAKAKMTSTKKPKYGDSVSKSGAIGKVVSVHHKNGCLIEWSDGSHESVSSSVLKYSRNGKFEL